MIDPGSEPSPTSQPSPQGRCVCGEGPHRRRPRGDPAQRSAGLARPLSGVWCAAVCDSSLAGEQLSRGCRFHGLAFVRSSTATIEDQEVRRCRMWPSSGSRSLIRPTTGLLPSPRRFGSDVVRNAGGELPPHFEHFPEHDHAADGQEEVYTALSGSATLHAQGERHRLEPGVFARVGPGVTRRITTDEEPVQLLAIGATPGKAYSAPPFTERERHSPAEHLRSRRARAGPPRSSPQAGP